MVDLMVDTSASQMAEAQVGGMVLKVAAKRVP